MWKAVFSAIGHFICGLVSFVRNIVFISFLFLLSVFILTIVMPENVQKAIEIFRSSLNLNILSEVQNIINIGGVL